MKRVMKPHVFTADLDVKRNRLRVGFHGVVTGAELQSETERMEEMLRQLRPEFVVIADLTEVEIMDLDCLPAVTRLMDLYLAAKVGRVVRVIPDAAKDIGFNILSITHYRGRVPTLTCESRAEAEAALKVG